MVNSGYAFSLQKNRRLSVICLPFVFFRSTSSVLAFLLKFTLAFTFFFLLFVFCFSFCFHISVVSSRIVARTMIYLHWHFCFLESWNFYWWHINLDLMFLHTVFFKGFAMVLSVFCSLCAIGGLLCHQFDSCCCIRQLQKSGIVHFIFEAALVSMKNKMQLFYLCSSIQFSCCHIVYYLCFRYDYV